MGNLCRRRLHPCWNRALGGNRELGDASALCRRGGEEHASSQRKAEAVVTSFSHTKWNDGDDDALGLPYRAEVNLPLTIIIASIDSHGHPREGTRNLGIGVYLTKNLSSVRSSKSRVSNPTLFVMAILTSVCRGDGQKQVDSDRLC